MYAFDIWKVYGTFSVSVILLWSLCGFVWEGIGCVLLSSLCHNTLQVLISYSYIVFSIPFISVSTSASFNPKSQSHVVDAIHCPFQCQWYSSSTKKPLMTRSRVSAKIPPCPIGGSSWVGKAFLKAPGMNIQNKANMHSQQSWFQAGWKIE